MDDDQRANANDVARIDVTADKRGVTSTSVDGRNARDPRDMGNDQRMTEPDGADPDDLGEMLARVADLLRAAGQSVDPVFARDDRSFLLRATAHLQRIRECRIRRGFRHSGGSSRRGTFRGKVAGLR